MNVGVGELRQNLSKFLRRVERGEHLVVTDRNRPVAQLLPLSRGSIDRLAAEGRVVRGEGRIEFKPVKLKGRTPASDALRNVRGD